MKVMKPHRDVGIVGYGAYVPRYRLPGVEIRRMWETSSRVHRTLEHSSIPAEAKSICLRAIVPCERIYEVELEIRRTKRLMKK